LYWVSCVVETNEEKGKGVGNTRVFICSLVIKGKEKGKKKKGGLTQKKNLSRPNVIPVATRHRTFLPGYPDAMWLVQNMSIIMNKLRHARMKPSVILKSG